MKRTVKLSHFLLALALLLAACSASEKTSWKGREVRQNGMLHVENPPLPMETPPPITLHELWRAGGPNAPDSLRFGVISAAVADPDGNVFLLDRQADAITGFSSNGSYLSRISGRGEKGRFQRATGLFFLPGDTLVVVGHQPGKLVFYGRNGTLFQDLTLLEGFQSIITGGMSAGPLAVLGVVKIRNETGRQNRTFALIAYDARGQEKGRYHEQSLSLASGAPSFEERSDTWPVWALGPDGRLFAVTHYGEYRIDVWGPDQKPDRVIMRPYEPLPRTETEKERARIALIEASPDNPTVLFADRGQAVLRLYPREDGSVWVLTGRGVSQAPSGSLGLFDVFDAQGRFLRQVDLRGEGNPKEDTYYMAGDRLIVVRGNQAAATAFIVTGLEKAETPLVPITNPLTVICYRLPVEPPAAPAS